MTTLSTYTNPQVQRQDLLAGYNTELISVVPNTVGALASFAGTAQENLLHLGGILIVTTANLAGAGTWKPSIQMMLPDGSYTDIWAATAAIATATVTKYAFYAQSSLSDFTATEKKNIAIPRRWRVYMTYGGNGTTDKMDVKADMYLLA